MVKVKNDLTGKIFGRLKVLCQSEDYIVPSNGKHYARWLCECSCEDHNQVTVTVGNLTSGKIQSCGCLARELLIEFNQQTKHKVNDYDLSNEYGIGYTSNTHNQFFFDKEDYDLIKDHCWCEHIKTSGYHALEAYDQTLDKIVPMITVLGCKGYDHIDRNPLNNRRSNLRKATQAENTRNRSKPKNNTSNVIGVGWMKKINKWRARITVDEQNIYLGVFDNKIDAIRERLIAEKKYFGEFAPQRHLFEKYNIREV